MAGRFSRIAVSAAASLFTIYLAPASKGGSDSHTGLTTSSPILTLARAQQVLQQSTNTITLNKFENISAEAIKVRDRSNFNVVEHNTFTATGGVSAYRDQFCDQACVNANPGTSRQCASYGNKFYFNTIGASFTGGQQNTWTLDPPGQTYAGNSGCSIPAGEERLHEGSNTLAMVIQSRLNRIGL